jgi:alkylation response protein AidB-like acyl-CoA dehydrogenase
MYVSKENVLGEVGRGLKLALTVLDFGRTTFGACCTGAAKFCIERMVARANTRRQFGQTLGQFELVRGKIAEAAADMYAMESATYHTAALIDSGAEDYMVETAMIKVFASEQLWRITNDCMQIWGGKGFFTDQPFERLMRDARLNLVGEGANDVLRCFIASVGFRHVGTELKGDKLKSAKGGPGGGSKLMSVWLNRASVMGESLVSPKIPVKHEHLRYYSRGLGKQIAQFSWQLKLSLAKYQEGIINKQYLQARLADIATELFMASCVYSRLTSILVNGTIPEPIKRHECNTGRLYLRLAHQRNEQRLLELKLNVDEEKELVAKEWLNETFEKDWVLKPEAEIEQ